MSFIQNFVTTVLPKAWSQAIQHESQNWLLRCPACDSTRSVWDLGGIRFKAASINKKIYARCPHCSKTSMMPLEYRESP
jgi:uncharacterized C2H2 Zn-finger protein